MRSCQEKTVSRMLGERGVEHYVPIRKEWRQWSDRKVLKDRVLMPRTVFVRCTESERRKLLEEILYMERFMVDRLTRKVLTVPEGQMEVFRRMVDGSAAPVEFRSSDEFLPGDRVRVKDGPLKDMECEVSSIKNKTFLCVRLGILGVAITEIQASQVEKI